MDRNRTYLHLIPRSRSPRNSDRFEAYSPNVELDRDEERRSTRDRNRDSPFSAANSEEESYLRNEFNSSTSMKYYQPAKDFGSNKIVTEGSFLGLGHKNILDRRSHEIGDDRSIGLKQINKSGIERNLELQNENRNTNSLRGNDESDSRLDRVEKMLEFLLERESSKQVTVPRAISETSHFTTSMWLNEIQDEAVANNWDDETIIHYMQSKMSGLLKAWFHNLPKYNYSWREWKLLIAKSFPDHVDFVETLKRLVWRVKQSDESMMQYYFCKLYLIEATKITGRDAVSCIIDGLNNQVLKEEANSLFCDNPDELFSQFLITIPDEMNVGPEERIAMSSQVAIMESRQSEIPSTEFHNQPVSFKKKRLKCRVCQKRGHLTQECYLKRKPCRICGKLGHLTDICKFRKIDLIVTSPKRNFESFFKCNCKINNMYFLSLIDTGCDSITVKEEIARELCLKYEPSSLIINGYAGGQTNVIGETMVDIEIDSIKACVPILIVPDTVQSDPVIIGQTLLNRKDIIMISHRNRVHLCQKTDEQFSVVANIMTKTLEDSREAKERMIIVKDTKFINYN